MNNAHMLSEAQISGGVGRGNEDDFMAFFLTSQKKKYQYMYIVSARRGLQRDYNVWCFYLEIRKMISVPLPYQKHWSVFTQSEH